MTINYKLKMNIGRNIYYGTMKLDVNGENASGMMSCNNIRTSFNNGKVNGNKIEFSGRI